MYTFVMHLIVCKLCTSLYDIRLEILLSSKLSTYLNWNSKIDLCFSTVRLMELIKVGRIEYQSQLIQLVCLLPWLPQAVFVCLFVSYLVSYHIV